MSVAVITFPGSNCDRDCVWVAERVAGQSVHRVWHQDTVLPDDVHAVMLPGGFSYGDYLRAGAMAAQSPILSAVKRFAERGGPILGICNGFQILCESGLLPGVLLQNDSGQFQCELTELEVVAGAAGLLRDYKAGERIVLPIAHADGNYYADEETLDRLERDGKVAFRYVARDEEGNSRINGARRSIAGLLGGPKDNVLGLMPHPERRAEMRLGGEDGRRLIETLCTLMPNS